MSRMNENASTAHWTEPTPVIVALFTTLGRLAAVAPRSIYHYMDEFIPILAYMMQDTSCFLKRSVSCCVSFIHFTQFCFIYKLHS